jgi:hypothetical protein
VQLHLIDNSTSFFAKIRAEGNKTTLILSFSPKEKAQRIAPDVRGQTPSVYAALLGANSSVLPPNAGG